ncbi:peptidyl-tRNA hydrolase [Candidatus Giovannonibacteria bacterium]|nr:peptidyl-tRNA hydrolase [Candidatus Giovannonibacteria bacterium]
MSAYCIVGLGNPGTEYDDTPHNTGKFMAELFSKKYEEKKAKIILPSVFMNQSGKAVKGIPAKWLILLHDDIDLPLGKFKIVFNRGSGGHKGVESVIRAIGSQKFLRIRIGICPPKKPARNATHSVAGGKPNHRELMKFLTHKFKPSESAAIKKISKKILEALETIITEGPEKAMTLYNNN